jgi:hypothetical protein
MTGIEERPCARHPDVLTTLRCNRCGKPICPRCMVETPVGYRCPECAGVRLGTFARREFGYDLRAVLVGVLVALLAGFIWGRFPDWGFYCALLLGFGVAEAIAWVTDEGRGRDLLTIGIGCVLLGVAFSRAVLAYRLGVFIRDDPGLLSMLRLQPIPDLVFVALAVLIPYVRFR